MLRSSPCPDNCDCCARSSLDGPWGRRPDAVSAAARYLDLLVYNGHVAGIGTPNQMREFGLSGMVKIFALWNPEELGTLPNRRRRPARDDTRRQDTHE